VAIEAEHRPAGEDRQQVIVATTMRQMLERANHTPALTLCVKGDKVVELVDPLVGHLEVPGGRVGPVRVKEYDGPLARVEVLDLLPASPELVVQLEAGGKADDGHVRCLAAEGA